MDRQVYILEEIEAYQFNRNDRSLDEQLHQFRCRNLHLDSAFAYIYYELYK